MIKGTITAIGENAIDKNEPILVLFGESATENLKDVSVIQSIDTDAQFDLSPQDLIEINGVDYQITHIGELANANLNDLSHTVLLFSKVPDSDSIKNGIYLSPFSVPELKLGSVIIYGKQGGQE